jgi:CBS domain containing-hemolysin-like protein
MIVWLLVLLCISVSFTFSGIEAGILSVNRIRLRHRVKMKEKAAIKLERLLRRPERLLVTALLVTNLMNIFAIVLSTNWLVKRLGTAGYAVSLLVWLPLYLFGAELLPKSLFRRFPYRALAIFAELLRLADLLLSPVLTLGELVGQLFLGNKEPEERKLFVAREDFKYFTIESERQGAITRSEREMIHNVVDFRSATAREVMRPLGEIETVAAGTPVEEFITRARKLQVDQLPVVAGDGKISGLVSVFELLVDQASDQPVSAFQRRILSVPATEPVYTVIRKMRAARMLLAVVTEGEKSVGAVSLEDLIKRIVAAAPQGK